MKYTKLFLAAALSAMMFSCTKEQIESEVLPSGDRKISQIVATFADDGVSALWSPGDEISVMYGSAKVKFTAANETPSQETIFTSNEGILFGAGEENYIWAACPHSKTNKLDGNTVTLSVSSAQTSTYILLQHVVNAMVRLQMMRSLGKSHFMLSTSILFLLTTTN